MYASAGPHLWNDLPYAAPATPFLLIHLRLFFFGLGLCSSHWERLCSGSTVKDVLGEWNRTEIFEEISIISSILR